MTIRTILLVDDEPDIRTIARMSLEEVAGWRVLVADSGQAAVDLAASCRPDVILLDAMMPVLDGAATLALLRSGRPTCDVPVIFMTAKVQKHEIERFLELGAIGVIKKPFDPMTLPDEVRAIMSREPTRAEQAR